MDIFKAEPFANPQLVEGVVAVYRQSFGGDPWNEGLLCPSCGENFPLSADKNLCPSCGLNSKSVPLVEYWPRSKVMADFYKEMAKSGSLCLVAVNSRGVEGFAWGYGIAAEPGLDAHLDAPGVHRLFEGKAFYLDECAVRPSDQGKGLGKRLVEGIFEQQPHTLVILRTKEDSRMRKLITNLGGTVIMRISRERVIMSCRLSK